MKSTQSPTPQVADLAVPKPVALSSDLSPPITDERCCAAPGSKEHSGAGSEGAEHDHPLDKVELLRISFVALCVVLSWSGLRIPGCRLDLIALFATLIGGFPIYQEALSSAVARRMTMELSMTIALGAALLVGECFTALVIVLFVLVAEVLEHLTVGRGRQAIKQLVDLLPGQVLVRQGDEFCEVAAAAVQPGHVVLVKPGSRVPVDGEVISGSSFVDQATVTGESMPVEKLVGSRVYAGTINQSGVLELRTTGAGKNTAFGRIIEAVEHAEQVRAPIQRTADRLAGYLVYFAIGCAILTYAVTGNARSTISVVIVAGACGIAAGTPLAILGGVGRAARAGAIIKGGLYLEILGRIDTVVLDKTGTVTTGEPRVTGLHPCAGVTAEALVGAASIAEQRSEHPLARAILQRSALMGVKVSPPDSFDYTPGRGIRCSAGEETILVGNRSFLEEQGVELSNAPAGGAASSEVLVARRGLLLGTLQIEDVVRPGARAAVAELRRMGLRTILLTGDAAAVGSAVAHELAIGEVESELMPNQKAERIKALVQEGCQVAMIGDGINDAPALVEASVAVAIGSGTDVTRECADVVLLGNDLMKFAETVRIARWCHSIIMTNFAGTLLVDVVGVALAAFGFLNPLVAAFIHVSSELAFILNSARILPERAR